MGIQVFDLGVDYTGGSTSNPLLTATVPAGSLIVVGVTEASAQTTLGTVGDGGNNIYTPIASQQAAGATNICGLFFCYSSVLLSAATLTYTKHSSSNAAVISALYATGIMTGGYPLNAVATAQNVEGPFSVTSASPTGPGLFVGWGIVDGTAITFNQAPGWTAPLDLNQTNNTVQSFGGNIVLSPAGPVTWAPPLTGDLQDWGAIIAGFLAAPGPSPGYAESEW